MKPFELHRHDDETGVSGTGHIADGVIFEDGTVAMRWRTEHKSTAIYANVASLEKIHGHNGKTEIRYVRFIGLTEPVMDTSVIAKVRDIVDRAIDPTSSDNVDVYDEIEKLLAVYVKQKGPNDARDWRMTFMCSMCLADDDIDGHCLNCGAGGTTLLLPMWFIEDIRKNASWVCKRYYPADEDVKNARELRALRERMPEFPGRTAELLDDPRGGRYWSVRQLGPDKSWISVSTPFIAGDTEDDAIARTRGLLPWNPEVTWTKPESNGKQATT